MAKKTNEITPLKAVLIYSIALLLVVFSELPRVLSWVQETRWKLVSGQMLDSFAGNPLKSACKVSDAAGGADQAQIAPSAQPYQEGVQAAQPAVSALPAAQRADGPVSQPDSSSGGDVESPPPQSAHQAGEQQDCAPEASSPKLKPNKVLLVGDSMIAKGFGPALQRWLTENTSIEVIRKGQYSTGFVHQEDFNWASALMELIRENKPDLIVVQMGANDPIDILEDSGKRLYCGDKPWREAYASRVRQFLKVASSKKIASFWVGLPIMGPQKYCEKISVINSIARQECSKASGCVYVDTWPVLADSKGKYTTFIKGPGKKQTRIRAKDNVHLTAAGGRILSEYFLRAAGEYVVFPSGDEGNGESQQVKP